MTSLSLFIFMHWRRKWQPTPVFLPGESQGRGSLVGCCLWGRTESDMTDATWQQQQQQFSSVAQLRPTLCNPMDCSMQGFPFHHQLMFTESVMPSNYLILCRPLLLLTSIFPSIRSFPVSQFFTSGGQSIGTSASTS